MSKDWLEAMIFFDLLRKIDVKSKRSQRELARDLGFSLGKLTFLLYDTAGFDELDNKNWAVDFGGLKPLKKWLEDNFDHKLAVDRADPLAVALCDLEPKGLAEIVLMDGVGCEKFAEHAFNFASNMISEKYGDRCWVESVEVREHGANSGIYVREQNGK